jgi:hypothetical protein
MSTSDDIVPISKRPIIRGLAFVILLAGLVRMGSLGSSLLDADLWWHLRDGAWIVAQHAVPHQGVFSQYSNHPWIAYSWGFEVILSRFYHWFGLVGVVGLLITMEVAIAGVLFLILWRGLNDFWKAWLLTAAGMWAMHHCLVLQPMLASILLFAIEVGIIWEARRKNDLRPLFLLPVLFLFWANLHIQFVYGLLVLTLLVATRVVRRMAQEWGLSFGSQPDLPFNGLLVVWGISVLATLIGPYSWQLYTVILGYMRSSVPYNVIVELEAMNFRAAEHYVLLLIIAGAFFTLGWRRSGDLFKAALLVICTLVAFRMTRDSWFVCVPALAIIADTKLQSAPETVALRKRGLVPVAATGLVTILVLVLVAWDSGINNPSLEQVVAGAFPVNASNFIRAQSLPRPIYNDLNWGGFIIWSLPDYPVAIDGRTDLYGDEIVYRFYQERWGPPSWASDPNLSAAKLVLLKSDSRLAMLLHGDQQHFRLVYSDPLAVVFIRTSAQESSNANEATEMK